ncbi:hypothetical protein [Paenibacillus campinasensis]|nr:hypothetical protein [Paenibacillus campinasensis]
MNRLNEQMNERGKRQGIEKEIEKAMDRKLAFATLDDSIEEEEKS